MPTDPKTVLDFWINAGPKKWWRKDPSFDAEIEQKFGETYRMACKGELDHWQDSPGSALALILVLDQFSRNLNRNSALAFAQDDKSVEIVKKQIASGADRQMPPEITNFCYLPLMHSENLANQKTGLELMRRIGNEMGLRSAIEHHDIIAEFGRFPHRNTVLGRETTPQEQAFLDDGGFAG